MKKKGKRNKKGRQKRISLWGILCAVLAVGGLGCLLWAGFHREPDVGKPPEHTAVFLYAGTDQDHYTTGSGFIMEITDQKIFLCTNRHVIQNYDEWEVSFWNGTKVSGRKLGISEEYDVGVVEIDRGELSEEECAQLAEASVDLKRWGTATDGQMKVWVVRTAETGLTGEKIEGQVTAKWADFEWGNGYPQTELDMILNPGDSGSAVFDMEGNLVSMVYGTSHEEGKPRRWGVPLEAVIACYEEITGRIR